MNEFKGALARYLTGELSLEGLESALGAELASRPEATSELLLYIEQLYQGSRITHQVYAVLKRRTQAGPDAGDDRTRFRTARSGEPDRTIIKSPRTQQEGPPSVTPDPGPPTGQSGRTGSSQWSRHTGTSGRTGTSGGFTGTSQWTGASGQDSKPVDVGSIIEDKFVLERVLGQGGMGTVYKARDLLAEEAQDRRPYVALKLLNDEFRRHRDSFQALQREASRTQKLNHPNVVAVRNFSRDRETGHVYMTMELLEGEPLDRFIKRKPDGVSFSQALPIISGLCNGLEYAHGQGIVHSDFKPGNAYLTEDGTVKIFDFGIARASKKRRGLVSGDKTLFDAGTLGAITPAYASLEMHQGAEPDAQDDIYALACITYELLTGRHPFDKTPADKALEQKLVPKRPKGLSGRQWRGLQHGLAFERAKRTNSAQQFLVEISPLHIPKPVLYGVPLVLILLILLGIVVIPQVLDATRLSSLEATLVAGDPAAIEQAMADIEALRPDLQSKLLPKGSQARTQLLAWFRGQIGSLFDPRKGNYRYEEALLVVERLERISTMEGDAFLENSALEQQRNQAVDTLRVQLNQLREQRCLLDGTPGCPASVLASVQLLRQLKPDDEALLDQSLPLPFAEAAEAAFDRGELDQARRLAEGGLLVAPEDARLKGLQARITERQGQERVAEVERRLRQSVATWRTLADVDAGARADFEEVRKGGEFGAGIVEFRQRLSELLAAEAGRLAADGRVADARRLVTDIGQPFLATDALARLEAVITGAQPPVGPSPEEQFATARDAVDGLIGKPDFTGSWAANLAGALAQLEAVPLKAARGEAELRRGRAIALFAGEARRRARTNDFAGAESLLEAAEILQPGTVVVRDTRSELERLRAEASRAGAREKQLAELKAGIDAAANDGNIAQVEARLAELRKQAPDDPWLRDKAPEAVAKGFTIRATSAYARKDYIPAMDDVNRALAAKPDYRRALDLRKRIEEDSRRPEPVPTPVPPPVPAAPAELPAEGETSPVPVPVPPPVPPLTVPAPVQTTRPPPPPPVGDPCSRSSGGNARFTCQDPLPDGASGPTLVVVPAGGPFTRPAAFTKYEVRVQDYNRFCQATGCSSKSGAGALPVTSVSSSDAQGYARWLSEVTGQRYRLPTGAEWEYAARASGPVEKTANCQLRQGGNLVRGQALLPAATGDPNGWGLVNFIGNARELVQAGGGFAARGGAYTDSFARCSIELEEPFGGPDAATGFRLVRDTG